MQPIGPLMLDIVGHELLPEEKRMVAHPNTGGILLFQRNFLSRDQLIELIASIRQSAGKPLLIAVDHEGGRVWRFEKGFTRLPAARHYHEIYQRDPKQGLEVAFQAGWVMASELIDCGLDMSFAPVLDLDKGLSEVIGDRAFHRDPSLVVALAKAFIEGMNQGGMQATGKHFPGHGGCAPDSHVAMPIDDRSWPALEQDDLVPFAELVPLLGAIMPAHITFPSIDSNPVGFSKRWLQSILRVQLGFQGAIISDCISMAGAAIAGSLLDRANKALQAGCDMVICCQQQRAQVLWLLDQLDYRSDRHSQQRLTQLQGPFQAISSHPQQII